MSVLDILADKGRKVITIEHDQTVAEALHLLATNRIGAAVVMRNGKVCGILSERDIVRDLDNIGPDVLQHSVSGCMTKDVITAKESDTVDEVMGLMSKGRFRHMPVMEKDNLIGVVSIRDVIKRKLELTEADVEEMKKYIAG
ncbi:CBS domain-containing protein [Pseudahrensia aquimaris]|uniref:CBS domain-containing protein n=1 Tax=Pseudahrensia aquimaris TaxID=744461 RepID=A0ABW3FI11_9HYPH